MRPIRLYRLRPSRRLLSPAAAAVTSVSTTRAAVAAAAALATTASATSAVATTAESARSTYTVAAATDSETASNATATSRSAFAATAIAPAAIVAAALAFYAAIAAASALSTAAHAELAACYIAIALHGAGYDYARRALSRWRPRRRDLFGPRGERAQAGRLRSGGRIEVRIGRGELEFFSCMREFSNDKQALSDANFPSGTASGTSC